MEGNKAKIRYILQYHFDQGDNAEQAAKKICAVYGATAVSNATAKRWFQRFRSGNMDVGDEVRSGRPTVGKVDRIMEIVASDRHVSTYSIAQDLHVSQKTVWNHLHKAGLKKMHDVWVPHDLSRQHRLDRVDACDLLLKRNEIDPFLKRLVTGDVKLVTYENNSRKRAAPTKIDDDNEPDQTTTTTTTLGSTSKKVLLCVWWDWQGVVHYELLPPGQTTLDANVYGQQLARLKQAIDQKRPELANSSDAAAAAAAAVVVFQHDNARPHISLATRQQLHELGWLVLSNPAHSPDLAPSDYHLFKHLQNHLDGKKLATREACEIELANYFANRDGDFFSRGIMKLPAKWRKVVEVNGAHI